MTCLHIDFETRTIIELIMLIVALAPLWFWLGLLFFYGHIEDKEPML